ncbi:DNA damage-regulated autophagy modulator protein 1 [Austrofundulus limnaeus]|uniref:DNA damage-regulated autophagy modulator protein 1 n=1 Tax=Austrofundulus limnaeus TaxID=52670 RepID=A0A2I4AVN0_AUSLI|nr:PREDICTED: DNA damage-regulated autophagy modulator protein 1 [Austrofundulus limnaeus]
MFWFQRGLCALPAFLGVWSSATFIISFIIAVWRQDIDVVFPYISDTGAVPPESCFFGLMTFICACAGIGTVYARYKFVQKLIEENNVMKPCCNKASLLFGLGSCFGMSVVATFQETAVRIFHDIGALLFFASGVVYMITQCWISYTAHPYDCARSVSVVRVGLTVIAAVAIFPTIICGLLSSKTSLHWDKEDEQYALHLTSAACEWVVAFSFVFFFFTYIHDFKRFTLQVTTVYEQPF